MSLASAARQLRLGYALLLGKGEDSSGGRLKPSILADAMEAVIGAIYLDAGYAVTEEIVLRLFEERLTGAAKGPGEEDYKTRLQELCAQNFDELPVYRVTDSGPDHAKVFGPKCSWVAFNGPRRGAVQEAGRADGGPGRLVPAEGRSRCDRGHSRGRRY